MSRLRLPLAIFLIGASVSAVAGWAIVRELDRDRVADFARLAEDAQAKIDRRIDAYSEVLFGLRSYMSGPGTVSRRDFQDYLTLADADRRFPGIRALEFASAVPRSEAKAHEELIRSTRGPNRSEYAGYTIHPESKAEVLYPIDLVLPVEGNEAAIGLDLSALPDRSAPLEEARDSGDLVASGPVTLVQDPDRPGVLIFLASYGSRTVPVTDPARRRHFRGTVMAVFRVDEMLEDLLGGRPELNIEIYDVGRTIDSAPDHLDGSDLLFDGDGRLDALDTESAPEPNLFLDLDAGGRRWRMFSMATSRFSIGPQGVLGWVVGVAGILLSAMGAGLVEAAARARRRRQDEAFSSFLEFAPDAVVIAGTNGAILRVNAQAEALFGYKRSELLGQPIETLLPDRYRTAHIEHRARFAESPTRRLMGAEMELFGRRRDGTEFAVDISLSPVVTEEGPSFAAAIRDVSERRAAAQALEKAYAKEQEAVAQLQTTDKLKDEFLDITAHELRTPLTSILGFAELVLRRGDDADPATVQEALTRVADNARGMAEMIERLLDFSRLRAGKVLIEPTWLPFKDEVEEFVGQLVGVLGERQVEIDIAADLQISADRQALRHIMTNLLGNAAKYSSAGSRITISAARTDGTAVVQVSDEGVGIPQEDISNVFEHFYQGSTQVTGKRGAGIGLAIVKRYVELHGGTVSVDSAPGAGARFIFTLPQGIETQQSSRGTARPTITRRKSGGTATNP